MAKRKRGTNKKVIERRIKQGRGAGRGTAYKPWLTIHDVASLGRSSRVKGWKTKRIHHFLSKLELSYFYLLEWSPEVTDIREQYPLLPLAETLALAEQCGIKHPTDPHEQEPIVMTTDFYITVQRGLKVEHYARAVKSSSDLASERVRRKLEIERRYWLSRSTDWRIVTERDIPETLVRNIEFLHGYMDISDRIDLTQEEISEIASLLTEQVPQSEAPLRRITSDIDRRLGLDPGTSLVVVYHLIASRRWHIDMSSPLRPANRLALLSVAAPAYRGQEVCDEPVCQYAD